MDLKKLFNMAGVKEEHLEDHETSHRIFSVLEKAGSMGAVRKQTRRMTSVERSNTCTRLRSTSSSSLAPSKRPSCIDRDSPHAAKISAILARGSPFCYLPPLSEVPSPTEPCPPLHHVPSRRPHPPIPPYLTELSQSFSPAVNPSMGHRSKKRSNPLQPLPAKNVVTMPPPLLLDAQGVVSETGNLPLPSIPEHSCPDSATTMVSPPPSLSHIDNSSDTNHCVPAHFSLSNPCTEPPIKLGDVQSTELFTKHNLETITLCNPKECLLNTDPVSSAVPPPPPPPPNTFINQSPENPLFHGSRLPFISQVQKSNNSASKTHKIVSSNKELEQQTNPAMFLDQIKQGVQLKSVNQTVKVENAESPNIVTALMDVLKRRHKAIHYSDDEVEDDDWED
ncbi:hypothetical protein PRIEUP_LOCUS1127 [Pristimantis euphronides]